MKAESIVPTKVAVGTSAILVSAFDADKAYTMVQADKANAQLIYVGGDATVDTATGFGELAAGETVTIQGAAPVWCIAGGAAQNVRVLTGL